MVAMGSVSIVGSGSGDSGNGNRATSNGSSYRGFACGCCGASCYSTSRHSHDATASVCSGCRV